MHIPDQEPIYVLQKAALHGYHIRSLWEGACPGVFIALDEQKGVTFAAHKAFCYCVNDSISLHTVVVQRKQSLQSWCQRQVDCIRCIWETEIVPSITICIRSSMTALLEWSPSLRNHFHDASLKLVEGKSRSEQRILIWNAKWRKSRLHQLNLKSNYVDVPKSFGHVTWKGVGITTSQLNVS